MGDVLRILNLEFKSITGEIAHFFTLAELAQGLLRGFDGKKKAII